MIAAWMLVACLPVKAEDRVLLLVPEGDAPAAWRDELTTRLRSTGDFLPAAATRATLVREGGATHRARMVEHHRARLAQARSLFRELEDQAALDVLAEITTALTAVHQEPQAVQLLARAHLLAGAIYLARGRTQAARTRLLRALDLDPDLRPARTQYAPQVFMELAALKAGPRSVGRLEVKRFGEGLPAAEVYVDGRLRGRTPLSLSAVPEGRHLLRVSAPGYTSYLSTVDVSARRDAHITVRLLDDPEVQRMAALMKGTLAEASWEATVDLARHRAKAGRVVVARIRPAAQTTVDGRPRRGVWLRSDGGGQSGGFLSEAERAWQRLRSCQGRSGWALPPTAMHAPALAPQTLVPVKGRPLAEREPERWWRSPWVWGATGAVVFGITSALVAVRAAEGPPDSVRIRVVPRP